MEANELRIGNSIECSEVDEFGNLVYKAYQVSVSDIWNIRYDEIRKKEYEPISLTEEWLRKFGFVNGEKENFSFTKNMDLRIFGHEADYNGIWIGRIESVHQLQNLYFALTGQELEYKE